MFLTNEDLYDVCTDSAMNRRQVMGAALGSAALYALPQRAVASSLDEVIERVRDADFIAIGEYHDNPDHHWMQADLVAALAPAGLAFEMIPQAREAAVNEARVNGASREAMGTVLDWANSGWPDWDFYAPILEAAPDAYIAGGGMAKSALGAVYAKGVSGLSSALVQRYGLAVPLPDAVMADMLDEQFAAHCEMLPRTKLGSMVAVQRAWDAAYAEAWRRASLRGGGGQSILICGNGHARLDRAAPALLRRALPDAKIASIGMLEGTETRHSDAFTLTMHAPAPPREDACEQMRKAMEKG